MNWKRLFTRKRRNEPVEQVAKPKVNFKVPTTSSSQSNTETSVDSSSLWTLMQEFTNNVKVKEALVSCQL
jgi:hypothetical protein